MVTKSIRNILNKCILGGSSALPFSAYFLEFLDLHQKLWDVEREATGVVHGLQRRLKAKSSGGEGGGCGEGKKKINK